MSRRTTASIRPVIRFPSRALWTGTARLVDAYLDDSCGAARNDLARSRRHAPSPRWRPHEPSMARARQLELRTRCGYVVLTWCAPHHRRLAARRRCRARELHHRRALRRGNQDASVHRRVESLVCLPPPLTARRDLLCVRRCKPALRPTLPSCSNSSTMSERKKGLRFPRSCTVASVLRGAWHACRNTQPPRPRRWS